jgi:hypothetical protein
MKLYILTSVNISNDDVSRDLITSTQAFTSIEHALTAYEKKLSWIDDSLINVECTNTTTPYVEGIDEQGEHFSMFINEINVEL